MFKNLFRRSDAKSDLADCMESIADYQEAVRLYKEANDINQRTIDLLSLTIESSKATLRGVLGIDPTMEYSLESLSDMTATYVITLEGRVN